MSNSGTPPAPQPVSSTTNVASRDPWGPAQPYLSAAMGNASQLYNTDRGYEVYPGQTVAQLRPEQTQALGYIQNIAGPQAKAGGAPGVLAGIDLGTNLIKNQGLAAGQTGVIGQLNRLATEAQGNQNPYLQGVLNQQMNQVNSGMSGAGRYGSGAHSAAVAQAVAPTLAEDYARRQALQQGLYGQISDIYGQGLTRAGQWSEAIPRLEQARYAPANMLLGVGDMYRQAEQQNINANVAQWNQQVARPWEQLQRYNAIIGGAGALGGTTTGTGTQSQYIQQPSTLQKLLGGAMSGAGMGSMFGPVGMGVGALGGGLLGMM